MRLLNRPRPKPLAASEASNDPHFSLPTDHMHAYLELRDTAGEFIEDTEPLPFGHPPRVGDQIIYGSKNYTVTGARHFWLQDSPEAALILRCRPANDDELEVFGEAR